MFAVSLARARDLGQWDNDPAVSEWFKTLMQPDNPSASCCGEADAYWADDYEIDKTTGQLIATVTDTRPDEPLKRPHIAVGTKFVVPQNKLKWNRGNPTGHNILFVSTTPIVYCFVQGAGI